MCLCVCVFVCLCVRRLSSPSRGRHLIGETSGRPRHVEWTVESGSGVAPPSGEQKRQLVPAFPHDRGRISRPTRTTPLTTQSSPPGGRSATLQYWPSARVPSAAGLRCRMKYERLVAFGRASRRRQFAPQNSAYWQPRRRRRRRQVRLTQTGGAPLGELSGPPKRARELACTSQTSSSVLLFSNAASAPIWRRSILFAHSGHASLMRPNHFSHFPSVRPLALLARLCRCARLRVYLADELDHRRGCAQRARVAQLKFLQTLAGGLEQAGGRPPRAGSAPGDTSAPAAPKLATMMSRHILVWPRPDSPSSPTCRAHKRPRASHQLERRPQNKSGELGAGQTKNLPPHQPPAQVASVRPALDQAQRRASELRGASPSSIKSDARGQRAGACPFSSMLSGHGGAYNGRPQVGGRHASRRQCA